MFRRNVVSSKHVICNDVQDWIYSFGCNILSPRKHFIDHITLNNPNILIQNLPLLTEWWPQVGSWQTISKHFLSSWICVWHSVYWKFYLSPLVVYLVPGTYIKQTHEYCTCHPLLSTLYLKHTLNRTFLNCCSCHP